ncbi:hypothetical protein FA13DRAFT_1800386 [Coprinellus micaceus]|uniref:Uncharacterized protein n=1 Tax=Coprinellus micaceus TaxID=71717 RepID=A0A4Y7SGU4_COPMI|nr:hypothetical protein FA13DRAFT_1800386 [Coprinellus micaceus]
MPPTPSPNPSRRSVGDDDPEAELDLLMAGGTTSDETGNLADIFNANNSLESSRTNGVLHARRLATRIGLAPYGQRELEKFVTETNADRTLLLYARVLQLDQKVSAIAIATGKYTVSEALMDNIQKCSFAVLLSPKLGYYKKGAVPVKRVLAVLTHLNVNPPDIATNYHVYKEIKKAVNHQLTQQRSTIKKELKSSVDKNKSIYELAVSLVEDTKCVTNFDLYFGRV